MESPLNQTLFCNGEVFKWCNFLVIKPLSEENQSILLRTILHNRSKSHVVLGPS